MIKPNKTEALQCQNEALTVKVQSLFLFLGNPHIRNLLKITLQYDYNKFGRADYECAV